MMKIEVNPPYSFLKAHYLPTIDINHYVVAKKIATKIEDTVSISKESRLRYKNSKKLFTESKV